MVREGDRETVLWPWQLRRCRDNPWPGVSAYSARRSNEWCQKQMRGVKPGRVVTFWTPERARPWTQGVVVRLLRTGSMREVVHTHRRAGCIHADTVVLTRSALKRARRHNRVWRAGLCRPSRTAVRERVIVSPATFDHLKGWVFNTSFVETLKASEQNRKRGHCYGVKETPEATFPRCGIFVRPHSLARAHPLSTDADINTAAHTHTQRIHPQVRRRRRSRGHRPGVSACVPPCPARQSVRKGSCESVGHTPTTTHTAHTCPHTHTPHVHLS